MSAKYDCNVCRDFAGNLGGEPSESEPWNPDCYIHQYRWDKPRCTHHVALFLDAPPRCELEDGHDGPCRFVFMEPASWVLE